MDSFKKKEKHPRTEPKEFLTEWSFRPKEKVLCPSCSSCPVSVKIHKLEQHFRKRHPASPRPNLDCQGCGQSSVTVARLPHHIHCNIQQHTLEPFDAFKDLEVSEDVSDQATWKFRPKKQVVCPLCKTIDKTTVKNIDNLSDHILKCHDGQNGEAKFDKVKKAELDQIGCSGCKASRVGYVNIMMHWNCNLTEIIKSGKSSTTSTTKVNLLKNQYNIPLFSKSSHWKFTKVKRGKDVVVFCPACPPSAQCTVKVNHLVKHVRKVHGKEVFNKLTLAKDILGCRGCGEARVTLPRVAEHSQCQSKLNNHKRKAESFTDNVASKTKHPKIESDNS